LKQNWSKSEIRQLREGNPVKLRKWIRDYGDTLFTWLMVHYPVSPDQASERTVRIFETTFPQLSQYDPAGTSMYRWLIRQAESLYPKETPPRPQAAAQVLRALGSIGSAEIPDSLLEHPAVIGLVQAALTEMDEAERMVLLRRYHRIDPKASAELDPQFSSDSLGDHLVRARYYFRRHLLAWIYSLQSDIGEFSADSRINVFEKNLEKIFCSVPPVLKLPDTAAEELEKILLQQAQQTQAAGKSVAPALSRKSIWIAAAAVLLVLIAVVSFFRRCRTETEPIPLPGQDKTIQKPQPSANQTPPQNLSPEELKKYMARVFEAGSANDMEELLKALEEGPYPVQVAAAVFLGRIGDESAIGPLEKAARRWHPDPQEGNPFLTAIEQIEQRLTLEARRQEQEALAQQKQAQEAKQIQPVETPALPAEPNQKPVIQEVQQTPPQEDILAPPVLQEQEVTTEEEVIQPQDQLLEQEEIPAEEGEYPSDTEEVVEPNEAETEGTEEEYSTDEVQYIEDQPVQSEY
jgi:hypothetical protein